MRYKPDLDNTLKRCDAYWEKEIIDRCCAAVLVGPKMESPEALGVDYESYYYDADTLMRRYIRQMERTYFGGDALPAMIPYFGTASHSLFFGGGIQCRPDTVWLDPAFEDWDDVPGYDPASPWLKRQLELVKELARRAQGEFFVTLTDNCGVMDAVANLRGSGQLLYDLVDNPDNVKALAAAVTPVLRDTTFRFADLVRENNLGGTVHQWMHLWTSKGVLQQLQCDFSVMLSPDMYREFVLPELEAICGWLDYSVYHLDGQEQIAFLDYILSVKDLSAIQWTSVAGQPPASDFLPVLQRIQKADKNLVLLPQSWEVEKLMDGLSSKGLQMVVSDVQTREEADELLRKIEKWTHE